LIDVTGVLTLDSQVFDVSGAVTTNGLVFEDASKVLHGQCAALRAHGETSQFGANLNGPYLPKPHVQISKSPEAPRVAMSFRPCREGVARSASLDRPGDPVLERLVGRGGTN
jgi:hypothetical protein